QERVEEGQRLRVERLHQAEGEEVSFTPVLVVDGDSVVASHADLAGASVTARVVGEEKGPKIRGFTYKPKTNNRRRWGHRQKYTTIEITGISRSQPRSSAMTKNKGGGSTRHGRDSAVQRPGVKICDRPLVRASAILVRLRATSFH